MRKCLATALSLMLGLSLVGCGGVASAPSAQSGGEAQSQQAPKAKGDETKAENKEDQKIPAAVGSPEALIEQMQGDFESSKQELLDKQAEVFATTGDTYDGYAAHVQAVQDWYDLAVSETEALGARTLENARNYYRSVASSIDHADSDALDDALDDLYDLIYDDAFEDWYDVIYDDAFEDMYDAYYDGSIADAYDSMEYGEWYDAKSESYEVWLDAKSDTYEMWLDAKSEIYEEWLDIKSDFYNHEFDVDKILRLDREK